MIDRCSQTLLLDWLWSKSLKNASTSSMCTRAILKLRFLSTLVIRLWKVIGAFTILKANLLNSNMPLYVMNALFNFVDCPESLAKSHFKGPWSRKSHALDSANVSKTQMT